MQTSSILKRAFTLILFVSGMALFITYEAGYFSKHEPTNPISDQNAAFRETPGWSSNNTPEVIVRSKPIPEVMSSSKSTLIDHSGSSWMFPKSSPYFVPRAKSLTANTSIRR